jgi:hypothetical protein
MGVRLYIMSEHYGEIFARKVAYPSDWKKSSTMSFSLRKQLGQMEELSSPTLSSSKSHLMFSRSVLSFWRTLLTTQHFYLSIQHGQDVEGYYSKNKLVKPSSLGSNPWVVDTSAWPEGHILILDWECLRTVAKYYFSMVSWLQDERLILASLQNDHVEIS